MNNLISYIHNNSVFGYHFFKPFKKIVEFLKYRLTSDESKMKSEFKKNLGYPLDLNNPKTLNEKIQWLKINDRTPLHTKCADKYAVREYVSEKVGKEYLIPIVFETKNPRDIIPENLPDFPIIIKANHDSSGGIIVRDKSTVNWIKTQNMLASFLDINYYYRFKEWQYKNIERRIIVEKLLTDDQGAIPFDYKFHCFHGKVEFIQLDLNRFTNHMRNMYDRNWTLLPFNWCNFIDGKPKLENGGHVDKPKCLREMIIIAEKLSEAFKYVRIDLYEFNNRVYFGEVTFHPCSGAKVIHPEEWDYKFGEMIDLY